MTWTTHTHSTPAALAGAVADRIAVAMDLALAERRQALLALAGGRTSPPVFRQLASAQRDWSRVTILPSDERWVAADHADNNLRQMREAFAGADGIHWLSLVPALPTGDADAGYANAALAEYPQAFDVAMLGMGADGHFASLFPGAPNLAAALQVPATVGADSVRDQRFAPSGPAIAGGARSHRENRVREIKLEIWSLVLLFLLIFLCVLCVLCGLKFFLLLEPCP